MTLTEVKAVQVELPRFLPFHLSFPMFSLLVLFPPLSEGEESDLSSAHKYAQVSLTQKCQLPDHAAHWVTQLSV